MNYLTYFLVKHSFWEDLLEEFKDIGEMFGDFFSMIKHYTYDIIAEHIGDDIALLMVLAIGIIGVMIVCITIINR